MSDKPVQIVDTKSLLRRLEEPADALNAIGTFLLKQSERAFVEKRFGGERWPTRYPGQEEPFINFASALRDLNQSRNVRRRRLDREPVLRDEGHLLRGLDFRPTSNNTVEIGVLRGPARQYGQKHNVGGRSRQLISDAAREQLAEQLRRSRGRMKQSLRKLGFFFGQRQLITRIARRTFLGLTDQSRRTIKDIVRDFVAGQA